MKNRMCKMLETLRLVVFLALCGNAFILSVGCSPLKEEKWNRSLFGDIDIQEMFPIVEPNQYTIFNGDVLQIYITCKEQKLAEPFNFLAQDEGNFPNYCVDDSGDITLPVLGKVNVAGKSIEDTQCIIEQKLALYLVSPKVYVKCSQKYVSVLGAVTSPGTYSFPFGNFTVLEALSMAKGLSEKARIDNILLIRRESGFAKCYRLNLCKKETMESPLFNLKTNDLIYVETFQDRRNSLQLWSYSVGIVSSLLSVIVAALAIGGSL